MNAREDARFFGSTARSTGLVAEWLIQSSSGD